MRQRNDGQGKANALQNRFAAYLLTAVCRQKCAYIQKRNQIKNNEVPIMPEMEETINSISNASKGGPPIGSPPLFASYSIYSFK